MLNVHAAKGCNAMYEVYIFTMLQMLKEIAFGENNAENKLYSLYIPFPKKKICAIPVEFLYITIHVRL